jgi:oligopeptide transport system ATP-binding protein
MDAPALMEIDELSVAYGSPGSTSVRALDDVTFDIAEGETLAIVGESGSGKSTLARAIVGTLPASGRVASGAVSFRGQDLVSMPESARRPFRGSEIAFIPQDPLAALNPVHRVGAQIAETLRAHHDVSRRDAWAQSVDLLQRVGLPNAAQRAHDHPHRLSGGERQRVVIAMAIALEPSLLVADEPTTALDATVQAQIIDLLADLRDEKHLAMVLVTHDLGVVASIADRTLVLYAGRVAETAPVADLYGAPAHPYAGALLAAVPRLGDERPVRAMPGAPPSLAELPSGCSFHPRCPFADDRCRHEMPVLHSLTSTRAVACHHPRLSDG